MLKVSAKAKRWLLFTLLRSSCLEKLELFDSSSDSWLTDPEYLRSLIAKLKVLRHFRMLSIRSWLQDCEPTATAMDFLVTHLFSQTEADLRWQIMTESVETLNTISFNETIQKARFSSMKAQRCRFFMEFPLLKFPVLKDKDFFVKNADMLGLLVPVEFSLALEASKYHKLFCHFPRRTTSLILYPQHDYIGDCSMISLCHVLPVTSKNCSVYVIWDVFINQATREFFETLQSQLSALYLHFTFKTTSCLSIIPFQRMVSLRKLQITSEMKQSNLKLLARCLPQCLELVEFRVKSGDDPICRQTLVPCLTRVQKLEVLEIIWQNEAEVFKKDILGHLQSLRTLAELTMTIVQFQRQSCQEAVEFTRHVSESKLETFSLFVPLWYSDTIASSLGKSFVLQKTRIVHIGSVEKLGGGQSPLIIISASFHKGRVVWKNILNYRKQQHLNLPF